MPYCSKKKNLPLFINHLLDSNNPKILAPIPVKVVQLRLGPITVLGGRCLRNKG